MRLLKVGPGPEDFVLQANGPRGPRLIISSKKRPGDDPGTILAMDLASERAEPMRGVPADLRPVGLSLVGDKLYVIDSEKRRVEQFRVDGDTLILERSLADPLIQHANDLVALESGEIYLTNWEEDNVVYFDGTHWEPFAKVKFANGIAVAGDRLFVNSFSGKEIVIFDRKTKAKERPIELPAYPDNLLWEVPGKILNVAAVTSKLLAIAEILWGRAGSPSIGFRVDVEKRSVDTLYDLPDFKGSSTALAYQGRIYISEAVGEHMAVLAPV